jgi:hypothetical protein
MYYHYTNIESLFHIIKTRKVWFSSLAFMNDDLEGFNLHSVMAEVMNMKYGDEKCQKKMIMIDDIIKENLHLQLSFSASALHDDLSQWRAYTKLGQGVAIGFEDGAFVHTARKLDCIYDFDEKKKAIIDNSYLKANDSKLASLFDNPNGRRNEGFYEFIGAITDSLISFKNKSFSSEKETRWVFSATCIDDARFNIKLRPHRFGLTLYEEVNIDLSKIKRITLGPQVLPQNIKIFEDFMKINSCPAIIDQSNLSLR